MIEHHIFAAGNGESLVFRLPDGRKASVGVIEPGVYNLGEAEEDETILVTSGELISGGHSFGPTFEHDSIVFTKGIAIEFRVHRAQVSYMCIYG